MARSSNVGEGAARSDTRDEDGGKSDLLAAIAEDVAKIAAQQHRIAAMRPRKWILLDAPALALLAAAGWWFGSPWWTLWRMRSAAEAGDAGTLAAYIDFPALRASTRAQLRPRLGRLGTALARPAVDALVSPTALRLALVKKWRGKAGPDRRPRVPSP